MDDEPEAKKEPHLPLFTPETSQSIVYSSLTLLQSTYYGVLLLACFSSAVSFNLATTQSSTGIGTPHESVFSWRS